MSESSISSSRQQTAQLSSPAKIVILVGGVIIAALVFILYLPTMAAPPMYDENYLLAWWSDLSKVGIFSGEGLAYMGFSGCDSRDALSPFGNLATLIFAACSGGKIAFMHFCAVALHIVNSLLLLFASLKAQTLGKDNSEPSICLATSTVAALLFALSPLAPEAVSWLGGFPLQFGTTLSLLAFLLLCLATSDNERRNIIVSGSAGALAMVAGLCSAHLAVVVFFPAICLFLATRKSIQLKQNLRYVLVIYLAGALIGALYSSFAYLSKPTSLPAKVVALRESQTEEVAGFSVNKPIGNLSALVIPINRSINKNYNKTFKLSYLLIPAPLIFALLALVLSLHFRNRLGVALSFCLVYLLINQEMVDHETLVGSRWLYPILPSFSFLVATTLVSPLSLDLKIIESSIAGRAIKACLSLLLVVVTVLFVIPLTHTQVSSYKSQGKLWAKLSKSVELLGSKERSPYIIVRNLPQSLCIAPIISPFEPILIDTAEKLPRSQNLSAGAFKDWLRDKTAAAGAGNISFHFENQLVDLIKTDFTVTNKNFAQSLAAKDIAKRVTPPLEFYRGAVKLDGTEENLLLESNNTNGAALRIDCEGLSPELGDYLYVEAKIDGPQLKAHTPVELHWLTNWNIDWEPRDRKTQVDAFANDNQYHHYYFPLRSSAWTTNGFPSFIMLGFPAGARVALKSIGIAGEKAELLSEKAVEPVATASVVAPVVAPQAPSSIITPATPPPAPLLTAQASLTQSPNKRHFAAFTFNYPDLKELGLVALYGKDNCLILNYDASKIESATGVKFEIGPGNSKFKADNAEYPDSLSKTVDHMPAKGTLVLKSSDELLKVGRASTGTVYPVRVFALDKDSKVIGRSSDSLHCLIDTNLSAQ